MTHRRPCVGCIVLAAGSSRRFGSDDKLLADLGGKPLAAWVLTTLPKDAFSFVGAVTSSEKVEKLCAEYGCKTVRYDGGLLSDSIRQGLALAPNDLDGLLFVNADRPFLREDTIRKMVRVFQDDPDAVVRMTYRGTPSNPVLFPSTAFEALERLEGDRGGSAILKTGNYRVTGMEAEKEYETYDADDPATLAMMNALAADDAFPRQVETE